MVSHGRSDFRICSNVPKGGRNDPCPCGSGKKHKRCCGSGDGELTFSPSPESSTTLRLLIQFPAKKIFKSNLAGVVQQLRKERDHAARTVEQLDAALAALNGASYGAYDDQASLKGRRFVPETY